MSAPTGSSSYGGGGTATSGSVSQQAQDMTRNLILGIPKEGLASNSEEAAQLQAAEAFVSDIQQEILAYDIANAQAVEAYARRWWSKVPFLGRHARRAIEEEMEEAREAAAAQKCDVALGTGEWRGGLEGLDAAAVADAASMGTTIMHNKAERTSRGLKVERTSALDADSLQQLTSEKGHTRRVPLASTNQTKGSSWLFKRRHPGWVPLMQRWWVPWMCLSAVAVIWTPDVWKLRALYYCDYQYAMLRQTIHKAYWRVTMTKEDYETLIADLNAGVSSSVKSTDCPF